MVKVVKRNAIARKGRVIERLELNLGKSETKNQSKNKETY